MSTNEILDRATDAMKATHVFGPVHEHDGVTVIPAAQIRGGGGGGGGTGEGEEAGEGGGFGLTARPAGALVISGDNVRWKSAPIDKTRVIVGFQLVAVAYFVFAWLAARARASN